MRTCYQCPLFLVCAVVGIDVQVIVSCRPYPFGRHTDEPEHEGLDSATLLQSEGFRVKFTHEELVEVTYECRQQQEHGVLCHEGFGQPSPSEPARHVVEYTFLAAPKVIELHDLSRSGVMRKMGHQVTRQVFHTIAATEVDT